MVFTGDNFPKKEPARDDRDSKLMLEARKFTGDRGAYYTTAAEREPDKADEHLRIADFFNSVGEEIAYLGRPNIEADVAKRPEDFARSLSVLAGYADMNPKTGLTGDDDVDRMRTANYTNAMSLLERSIARLAPEAIREPHTNMAMLRPGETTPRYYLEKPGQKVQDMIADALQRAEAIGMIRTPNKLDELLFGLDGDQIQKEPFKKRVALAMAEFGNELAEKAARGVKYGEDQEWGRNQKYQQYLALQSFVELYRIQK